MSTVTLRRRRLALVALGVAALAAVFALAATLGGGSVTPPDTGAARLVPARALAYLNVSLDPRRPTVSQFLQRVSTLPGFDLAVSAIEARVGSLFAGGGDLAAEARPWIGDEAALAVLAGPGSAPRAGALVLLAVRRPAAARRFLAGLPNGGSAPYHGVAVQRLSGGSAAALSGHYLLLGPPGDVQAAIDAGRGATGSLASSPAFRRASAGAPAGRVADLYLPATGVSRLLGGYTGLRGALRTLLAQPGLVGVDAALSAAPGGIRLRVHSVFDASAGRAATKPFVPSLVSAVPAGAAAVLDARDLPAIAPGVLETLGQLGVGSAVRPLLVRLGGALKAEGADIRPLLELFGGESVVALTSAPTRPALLVITRTANPPQAKLRLANLEPALASLFPAASRGPGVAPLFTSHEVNGVLIHQLKLGPGLQVDYAVSGDLVGISTGVDALSGLARAGRTLPATAPYRAVLAGFNEQVSSLVFLDLKVLFRLGEQAGLLGGAGLGTLAPDLARIQAAALRSRSDKAESTSELYFKIS